MTSTKNSATIHAPGVVTGRVEVVAQKVTDLTGLATMAYDLAVDKQAREDAYNGLVKIKDQVKEDPSSLFPIFGEIILQEATGNTSEEWWQATDSQMDKGKQGHLLTKGVVRTVATVFASGKIITKLPEMADNLAAKMDNVGDNLIKYGKNFKSKIAKSALTTIEKETAEEAYKILNNSEFNKITNAFKKNESVEIHINRRTITYDDAPFSGMTYFEKDGFHIGREAFGSDDELIKTVLHETYRLRNSKLRGIGSSAEVAQETQEAFNFAEKSLELFK